MTYTPYHQSRTERSRLRQEVRNALGTSREGPPTARTVLRVAHKMALLVELSTGGALTLAVRTRGTGEYVDWRAATENASGDYWL